MKKLEWRGVFILALLASSLFLSFYQFYRVEKERAELLYEIDRSLQISHLTQQLIETGRDSDQVEALKDIISKLPSDHRLQSLSLLIQTIENPGARSLATDTRSYLAQEAELRTNWQSKLQTLHSDIYQLSLLAASAMALGTMLLFLFLRTQVFRPLQELDRQMQSFMQDAYHIPGVSPTDDEVGHLHAKFNSLAQQALNSMDELRRLDRAKSEFLNMASHELRTPLTSIKGSLGLLMSTHSKEADPKAKRLIHIATSETERMIRMINDLLDLAKIEAGQITPKKTWFPVDGVFKEITDSLQGITSMAGVSIEVNPCPHPTELHADPNMLRQIMSNLLSNAIKQSPRGSSVRIYCRRHEKGLMILVTDEGPGISNEDRSRIFDKFTQTSTAQVDLMKGTGLGLAIVRAFVEQHQGYVGVTPSQPGQGATFFFVLPEYRDIDASSGSQEAA